MNRCGTLLILGAISLQAVAPVAVRVSTERRINFDAGWRFLKAAFNGLALLIVRSKAGEAGRVHVTASADGLAQGAADLTTRR
jgi:hypothetical protein